jgi:hypothetical protein
MENREQKFENLSQFSIREVELFRSSDKINTAKYFINDRTNKPSEAYFEILKFKYDYKYKNQIYIRYPNTDYFVELVGGVSSGRGNLEKLSCKNIWVDEFKEEISINQQDDDLIIFFGKTLSDFNFMKKVDNSEISLALSIKYLKLPENIKSIVYCNKTKDKNPIYFLVDVPKYNFNYDNHRFFMIEDGIPEQLTIKNFERYRDGGTTYITVVDKHDVVYKFFSPSPFKNDVCEKINDIELMDVDFVEKEYLIKLLKLDVEDTTNETKTISNEFYFYDKNQKRQITEEGKKCLKMIVNLMKNI